MSDIAYCFSSLIQKLKRNIVGGRTRHIISPHLRLLKTFCIGNHTCGHQMPLVSIRHKNHAPAVRIDFDKVIIALRLFSHHLL